MRSKSGPGVVVRRPGRLGSVRWVTRWDGLFADLEAQASALAAADRAGEVEERVRSEVGQLRLVDRLRPSVGVPLRWRLTGGLAISGVLLRVGADFVLLDEGAGREALLPLAGVVTVAGLGRWSSSPGSEGQVTARLGLRSALRGLARDRSALRVHLVDGTVTDGTLDRVGADLVELAAHEPGEFRRQRAVRDVVVLPVAALVALRRDG